MCTFLKLIVGRYVAFDKHTECPIKNKEDLLIICGREEKNMWTLTSRIDSPENIQGYSFLEL